MTYIDEAFYGDIATDGEHLFYVYSDMSPWVEGIMDFTVGNSHLGVWGEDYSYTWTGPDSEEVYGVEILSDTLIAVGFEHGFSILNYTNLDSIYEVAHYRDTDSVFAFTHFARKDTRIYAMAHPHPDTCRMYMFELDDNIWASIDESPNTPTPSAFTISAHPNPFNSAVTITIDAPVGAIHELPLQIEIFDLAGRRVAQLPEGYVIPDPDRESRGAAKNLDSRFHGNDRTVVWQPNESIASGVYLVRARLDNRSLSGAEASGSGTITKRIVYLK